MSLFSRLFGARSGGRQALTCYIRENGPIAYELELFGAASARERTDALLSSGLTWAWKSGSREWTHLTRISLSAFLSDLPAGVLLVGGEEDLPTHFTDDDVRDWLRRFCRVEAGPLGAAISATPARQLLFVQQHASSGANALLDALGVDRRAAARSAYARLGPASLESAAQRL